jgi:hypothetical protein
VTLVTLAERAADLTGGIDQPTGKSVLAIGDAGAPRNGRCESCAPIAESDREKHQSEQLESIVDRDRRQQHVSGHGGRGGGEQ